MTNKREPHCMAIPGRRGMWTTLDCEVGKHRGVFPITRTPQGWACPKHGGEP